MTSSSSSSLCLGSVASSGASTAADNKLQRVVKQLQGLKLAFSSAITPPKHDPDASGCGSSSVPQKSHGDSYPNGLAKSKNDGGDSNFCTSERFQAIKNILQRQKERRLAMAAKKDDDDGRAKSGPNLSTDNPHVLPPFVSQLTLDLSIFLGNVSTQ